MYLPITKASFYREMCYTQYLVALNHSVSEVSLSVRFVYTSRKVGQITILSSHTSDAKNDKAIKHL